MMKKERHPEHRRLGRRGSMIPELVDGVLPEGLHNCTLREIEDRFGRGGRTEQRSRLTQRLGEFIEEARRTGFVAAVVIDGSYVTAKADPNDIDVIVMLQ